MSPRVSDDGKTRVFRKLWLQFPGPDKRSCGTPVLSLERFLGGIMTMVDQRLATATKVLSFPRLTSMEAPRNPEFWLVNVFTADLATVVDIGNSLFLWLPSPITIPTSPIVATSDHLAQRV